MAQGFIAAPPSLALRERGEAALGRSLGSRPPDGMTRSTSRFSGVKYLRATRLMSSVVTFRKMSNSPSADAMSF